MNKRIVYLLLSGIFIVAALILAKNIFLNEKVSDKELFAFGVMADVQYGDMETTGKRHYRESLEKLKECVTDFNTQDLAFTIQLGDIINGNTTPEKTLSDLDTVFEAFKKLTMPVYHVIGNHCMNAGKDALVQKLGLESFYYDFTVPAAKGWRFIVLDGNDNGYGVLGVKQLEWLKQKLSEAKNNGEKVIILNHFAVLESAAAHHRMKEPQPVLDLIHESKCVVAYFAGHDHAGGYAFEDNIHHVTFKGMVEAPVKNAYAVIKVYPHKMEIEGVGKQERKELIF